MKFDYADVKTYTVKTLQGRVPQDSAASAQNALPLERKLTLCWVSS
jgi:hypothetical protein